MNDPHQGAVASVHRCDITASEQERCGELGMIQQNQQIFANGLAFALALMAAAVVGQIAVFFAARHGNRLGDALIDNRERRFCGH